MPQIQMTREPCQSDKQIVRAWMCSMPFVDRGKPVMGELQWVLCGRPNVIQHEKLLPDYCYNIFDVFRKTYFKAFPLLSDTVLVTDQARLKSAKTIEEAKKDIRIDWRSLGKIFGAAIRGIRFVELEAKDDFNSDGFDDLSQDKKNEFLALILGKQWVAQNKSRIVEKTPGELLSEMLNQYLKTWVEKIMVTQPQLTFLAFRWSPEAMVQFNEGITEGMTVFLDVDGQFGGESCRAGIYWFLLWAWPEIKAMLEAKPRKTLTDLHKWMQPFIHMGVVVQIDIETLRDVCAPPPEGIGLSLRPLENRR